MPWALADLWWGGSAVALASRCLGVGSCGGGSGVAAGRLRWRPSGRGCGLSCLRGGEASGLVVKAGVAWALAVERGLALLHTVTGELGRPREELSLLAGRSFGCAPPVVGGAASA